MTRWDYLPGEKKPKDLRRANLGDAFEELLMIVAEQYRAQGIARIAKVPTAWKPIRGDGGFISCKIDERVPKSVDFVGSSRLRDPERPSALTTGKAIAFEAKHTDRDRIRWDEVTLEEREFLDDYLAQQDTVTFIICSFRMEKFYLVPWAAWHTELAYWEAKGRGKGACFMERDAPESLQVRPGRTALDYLATWESVLRGGVLCLSREPGSN